MFVPKHAFHELRYIFLMQKGKIKINGENRNKKIILQTQ